MTTTLNNLSDLDLGVDQQEDGHREDEDAEDPGAEAEGVAPDATPRLVPRSGVDEADRDDQGQDEPVDVDRAEHQARPSAFRLLRSLATLRSRAWASSSSSTSA